MFENYINEIQKEFQKTVGADVHVYSTQEMLEIMSAIKKGEKNAEDVPCPFIILDERVKHAGEAEKHTVVKDGITTSYPLDRTKELPFNITTKVTIYTLDIKDIVSFENSIQEKYNVKQTLHTEDGTEFDLYLSNDEIDRGRSKDYLQKELQFSSITFISCGAVVPVVTYHPAEVELDNAVQLNLLRQIVAVMQHLDSLNQKVENLRPEWYIDLTLAEQIKEKCNNNLSKEFEERVEKSKKYQPTEREIGLQKEIERITDCRDKLISNLFDVENVSELIDALGKNALLYLPELLKNAEDNKIGIKEATERFAVQKLDFDEKVKEAKEEKIHIAVKAEIERLKELKKLKEELERVEKQKRKQEKEAKLLESNGDSVLNVYTDAVVDYFKEAFKNENIDFFGGSALMDWYKIKQNSQAKLPVVVIDADVDFSFDSRVFYTFDSGGNQKVYYFNLNAMPIKFSVRPTICAKTDKDASTIEKIIREFFEDEKTIRVPVANLNNEFVNIKLQIDPEAETEWGLIGHFEDQNTGERSFFVKRIIKFKKHVTPYFYRKLSKEDLKYNQRLQFRTLQQIQFVVHMQSMIENRALNQLGYAYKNLFDYQLSLGRALDSLFSSADYRAVRDSIKYRRPVDRIKFDKVLSPLTIAYPQLYDRMMQGWSIDQIKEDLLRLANQYKERGNELFDLLEIPECILTNCMGDKSGRSDDMIKYYLKEMLDDVFLTIDAAIEKYLKPYRSKEEPSSEERKIQELLKVIEKPKKSVGSNKQQNNSESPLVLTYYNPDALHPPRRYYDDSYSSSSDNDSIGGSILGTAIGTAIGMHGVRKELKEANKRASGKPNLMGSDGCVIGKKNESGFTMSCNSLQCPLYNNCSRGK